MRAKKMSQYLEFHLYLHPFSGIDFILCNTVLWQKYFVIRKSKDYVYGIWVYKVLGIWKGYYRVNKVTSFLHETVNQGKK